MMTTTVKFGQVADGKTFSAQYGEHGQERATFRKTAFNMGRCLNGNWLMPFLLDESVEVEQITPGDGDGKERTT